MLRRRPCTAQDIAEVVEDEADKAVLGWAPEGTACAPSTGRKRLISWGHPALSSSVQSAVVQ